MTDSRLPQDEYFHPIQTLGLGPDQELTITDSSQASAAVNATQFWISSAEVLRIKTGAAPTVTKTTGTRIPANQLICLKITSGDKVAVIAEGTAAAGKVTITEAV